MEGGDRDEASLRGACIFLTKPEIGRTHPSPEALDRYKCRAHHRSFVKDNPGRRSLAKETDYERLEFLGTGVLNLIVAEISPDAGNPREV